MVVKLETSLQLAIYSIRLLIVELMKLTASFVSFGYIYL